jgi:RHS repeat-associated protein
LSEVSWGNLWHRTDLAGKTTTFEYDTLGRLKKKIADATHPSLPYAHAIARVEYDYDVSGARTAARTYGSADLLLYQESTPRTVRGAVDSKGTASGTLGYQYYANGQLKDVVSSNTDGVNVGYRYDELNRLQYVDDASAGATTRTSAYAYNGNGSLATVTYANGIAHAYGYDTLNRLRTLTVAHLPSTIVHSYTYALRASGHRRQVLEGVKTTTYDYDDIYRLTGETVTGGAAGTNGSINYTLDRVGNRLNRNTAGELQPKLPTSTSSFNARDWLNSDGYDPNGNTLTSLLNSVSIPDVYDFEDRLIIRHKPDGSTVNLSYDADGILCQKTVLSAGFIIARTTAYLIDTQNLTGYSQILEERIRTSAGTTVKTYTYGSDLISCSNFNSITSTSTTRFYAYDGLGSVRGLTDESGTITDVYDYDAFGISTYRAGATDNEYLYRGERFDTDIGEYSLRARFYNQATGRFWNADSYEGLKNAPASLHKYLYANANPLSFSDPSGYFSLGELSMVQNVQSRLNQMAIPNVRVIGQKVVKKLVCITAQGVIREGPIHHIATNKNFKAGKQFSKKFSDLFEEAGINLNHWANRLGVPGHKGPHPEAYHDEILKMLTDGLSSVSVEGLAAEAAQEVLQEALQNALLKVAGRLCNANDPLTKLIAP